MCSDFPVEKVEQMIMMSLSDLTVIAHAIGRREVYKGKQSQALGLLSGFLALNSLVHC